MTSKYRQHREHHSEKKSASLQVAYQYARCVQKRCGNRTDRYGA